MFKWLLLVAFALWLWLLRGFVELKTLFVLSVFGPLFLVGGVGLIRVMAPRLLATGWTFAAFLFGFAMIAAALATLSPAAPGNLLATSSFGWDRLDERTARLALAIDAGDVGLTRRLASRGLGDISGLGDPLVLRATTAEVLTALLESGLNPDARDEEGGTALMRARQPELVRALLAAGADVTARDREGLTVADSLPDDLRALVAAHAGRPLERRSDLEAALSGRSDWLTITRDPATPLGESVATVAPERVGRDQTATVAATLANPAAEDRWLDVTATLNPDTLFVGASAGGAIETPDRPQLIQTIRWPVLALPAHSQGRLALQLVTRAGADARDLGVTWQIRTLRSGAIETLQVSQRLSDAESIEAGRTRFWGYVAAGVALAVGAWLVVRRRRRNGSVAGSHVGRAASIIAAGSALALGLGVAAFLWSIVEPYLQFEAAACTILDRRVRTFTTTSSTSIDGSRRAGSSLSASRTATAPLAAVRIESVPPVITSGFSVGFTAESVQDLRHYSLGARVPCWVDPSLTGRFTLVRRPSASSALALGAMTLLAIGLLAIARGLSREHTASPRSERKRKPRRKPLPPPDRT